MLLRLAFQNLIQARRRTLLLSLAIGMVTTLLVLLLSMAHGIEDNLIKSATSLTTGHFNVFGWYKSSANDAAPIIQDTPPVLTMVKEKTPDLDYILVRHRGWAKLVGDTKSIQSSLQGMDLATESRFASTFQLAPESAYKEGGSDQVKGDLSKLANPHSLVLFASQAKRLGVDVGDVVTVQTETSSGRTNTLDVTVVAIGKDLGLLSGFVAILPISDILELYQLNPGTAGAILVYVNDIDNAESAMNSLRADLTAGGYQLMDYEPKPFFMKFETVMGEEWTGQRLDMSLWNDEVVFLTYALTAFNTITYFLILILGGIIGVGIMNTMWNSVRERTREIGMMRAVGMSRSRVLFMVLLEALVLGLVATTSGALLGAAIAGGLDAMDIVIPWPAVQAILLSETLHLAVAPSAIVNAVVLLTALTGAAAIWPAGRASRLRPITAIQQVE